MVSAVAAILTHNSGQCRRKANRVVLLTEKRLVEVRKQFDLDCGYEVGKLLYLCDECLVKRGYEW